MRAVLLVALVGWVGAAGWLFGVRHDGRPRRADAVVVAEHGRPVGVVTRSDLLDYLAHSR